MNRLRRFWHNAGILGIGLPLALIVVVVLGIRSGFWIYTTPLFVLVFLASYPFRGWLVEHIKGVRAVMNMLAIAAVVAAALLRRSMSSESLWPALVLVGLAGAYLGCYFWLLSDERVVSAR